MKKPSLYFPNLNSLRFIAAFAVIIHHIEQFKAWFHLPSAFSNPAVMLMGHLGVILFFVLSGFLISYLLLVEEKRTGTINIKDFYIRRMLRIWPLYYLVVVVAYLLLPHFIVAPAFSSSNVYAHFWSQLILYLMIAPNVCAVLFTLAPGTNQLWSIGVEEQFYLMWPLLFSRFTSNRVAFLLIFIAAYIAIRFGIYHLPSSGAKPSLVSFWENFNVDCMAIGALFAVMHFHGSRLLHLLYKKLTQVVVITAILAFAALGSPIVVGYTNQLYAVLFGIAILNFATNPNVLLRLENRATNYLGKISYGLYMYHPIAILIVIKVLTSLGIFNNVLLYVLAPIVTIGVAALSYHYFESAFIRLKLRFSKVVSGDLAHDSVPNTYTQAVG